MKVSDLLEADYEQDTADDAGRDAVSEEFHNQYVEIGAAFSVGFDELEDIVRDVVTKQRDANLNNELEILEKLGEIDDLDIYYVPRNQAKTLDKLDDIIVGDNPPTQIANAIREFLSILNKYMTTEQNWLESDEANNIRSKVGSEYEPDPYRKYGVKPTDFY
jgi:hypothetical protein